MHPGRNSGVVSPGVGRTGASTLSPRGHVSGRGHRRCGHGRLADWTRTRTRPVCSAVVLTVGWVR